MEYYELERPGKSIKGGTCHEKREGLKTLRDLESEDVSEILYDLCSSSEPFITTRNLRIEAVKWVKKLSEYETTDFHAIKFIKKFFNLTEDDIEDG